jgi:uncharacterized peroxidase-related enzyme
MLTGSQALSRALAFDFRAAELGAADAAMLAYAAKLTRAPARVAEEDVSALRSAGFDDAAILDICQVTAYYNYVNRLADGLGVELESGWTEDELTMTEEEFREAAALRAERREVER